MSNQPLQDAAILIAGCMMSHFHCPLESFSEFFPSDEGEIVFINKEGEIDGVPEERIKAANQFVSDNYCKLDGYKSNVNDPTSIAFRQAVLEQVKINLKL